MVSAGARRGLGVSGSSVASLETGLETCLTFLHFSLTFPSRLQIGSSGVDSDLGLGRSELAFAFRTSTTGQAWLQKPTLSLALLQSSLMQALCREFSSGIFHLGL